MRMLEWEKLDYDRVERRVRAMEEGRKGEVIKDGLMSGEMEREVEGGKCIKQGKKGQGGWREGGQRVEG